MKFEKVLEKSNVVTDSKARRRTNVSIKRANISADEIEDGVTIERLQEINVPVYRYATQVTIHGKLPEFNENTRPAGYKSIIKNANGTVGVRYVAIDAKKKTMIVQASRYCDTVFKGNIGSDGLMVHALFEDKEECLKAYREFPRDLFVGSVGAAVCPFGGYVLFAGIGAIPVDKMDALFQYMFGVTVDEFKAIKAKKDAEREAESILRQARQNEKAAEMKAAKASMMEKVASGINLKQILEIPTAVGSRFVSIKFGLLDKEPTLALYVVTKKVFGKPYCAIAPYFGNENWNPTKQDKAVLLEKKMNILKTRLDEGYVWKA